MSYLFEVEDRTVWSPALRVGQIYVEYVRSLERVYGLEAGFTQTTEDSVRIDAQVFAGFVTHLLSTAGEGRHLVLELELRAVAIPALVILDRAGLSTTMSVGASLMGEATTYARRMPE
ncbi:MAG TPA: DUF6086 family protein [Acidimicrobiales bacterium]|nr:DUF6086 family protein [Acidimicrobiales bacterium]